MLSKPFTNRLFSGILIFIPIVFFYSFIWKNALGIPFQDDIDGILGALKDLIQAPSLPQKFQVSITQDDEHRVFFDRFVTYLLYVLNGNVNLKTHLFIGCLLILGIFGLLVYSFRKANLPLWGLIPVSFLLFQIQYHEGIFWNMIPCQNFAVLFFAFLTSFLVSQQKKWGFVLAFFTAFIATISSGNGMLTFFPCVFILFYQRRWKSLGLWVVWMATCIAFYFHNLIIPAFRPKLSDNLVQFPKIIIADFFAFIGEFFDPGKGFSFNTRGAISIFFGVLILVWIFIFAKKLYHNFFKKSYPELSDNQNTMVFWMGGIIFIVATAAIFSVARAGNGFSAVLISRYKLNMALLVILVYCSIFSLATIRGQKIVFMLGLCLGVFANISSYLRYTPTVQNFRKDLITDAFTWENGRNLPSSPIYFSNKKLVDETLSFNLQNGYYHFPETVLSNLKNQILIDTLTQVLPQDLDIKITETSDYLMVSNDNYTQGNSQDDGVYIVLKSEKECHAFPMRQRRNGIKRLFLQRQFFGQGFDSEPILKKGLAIGKYKLGIIEVKNGQKSVKFTSKTFEIQQSLK
jgi:hypothetical protein